MIPLSDEEIYREVGKIVEPFQRLECFECAQAVLDWLKQNQVHGTLLKLTTRFRDEDYILSARLLEQGVTESITLNGTHYGVEVCGRVFDNLSVEGLSREIWLQDFSCPSSQFAVEVVEL